MFPYPIFHSRVMRGGGYSPLQEGTPHFWYDFSTGGTGDAAITSWADKSGNNRTLTFDATKQPTYKTNILNGLGAALFDATNDGGYTSNFDWGSYKATLFAVFTSASATDNYIAHFGPASGSGRIVFYRQNANNYGVCTVTDVGFSYCIANSAAITTSPTLLSATVDLGRTGRVQTFINGTSSGTPVDGAVGPNNFASDQPLIIGNIPAYNSGLNGYLMEIIGFPTLLSSDAHARIVAYFQAKWFPSGFNFGVGDFADNAYTASASQTSPAARVVVSTDADYALVKVENTIGAFSGFGDCGVRIDGSDSVSIENISTGTEYKSLYLGTKGTTRKVELINGIQSMSGTRLGSWISGAFFNGTASVVSASEPTTPRILVYGDSIAGGQSATNPSLSGWVQLLRNTYAATGSVVMEAWGNRKLKNDAVDASASAAFAAHIADNIAPTIIWLAIGANDLGAWTAAAFETAYGRLLDDLHAELPSAAIYAQTMIVRNPEGSSPDFRTAIGNAQSSRSAWCTLVDGTAAAFPQLGDLSVDGIHPTTAGHVMYHNAVVGVLGL